MKLLVVTLPHSSARYCVAMFSERSECLRAGLRAVFEQIGRARLLVVDELGFLPLDADGARLLFQVVSQAHEAQSVAFTTNLGFSSWGDVFGDDQMAAAVIDRVVHHGRLLRFEGESYRVRHSLMQGGAQEPSSC